MTESAVEISGTRKIVVLSVVGVVLALCIGSFFIPETRPYSMEIVKFLINFIPGFVK